MYAFQAFEEVLGVTRFEPAAKSSLCKQDTYSLYQTLAVARNSEGSLYALVISEITALQEVALLFPCKMWVHCINFSYRHKEVLCVSYQ